MVHDGRGHYHAGYSSNTTEVFKLQEPEWSQALLVKNNAALLEAYNNSFGIHPKYAEHIRYLLNL